MEGMLHLLHTLMFVFAFSLSALAQTPTHYVSPTGSSTSLCSQVDPCSLTRANALLTNGTINDGDVVLLQAGPHSQPAITISASGAATNYITIRFAPGAYLTSGRIKPAEAEWSLVPGKLRTYQYTHNQAVFNSSNPSQRNPTNWQPITVANNGTTDKVVVLEKPIRYRNVNSIDEVEAQGCSHFDTTTTVYVQTCDGLAPSDAHDLWLTSTGHGTMTVSGSFIRFENTQSLNTQKSGTNGIEITTSSDGVIFAGCDLWGTGITGRGKNTVFEDCRVGGVIMQGPAGGKQCYNPHAWAVGLCFNAQGTGSAVDLGISGSSVSFGQTWRRGYVYDSWNGGSLYGQQTVEDSLFVGFPNHTFSAAGVGGTVRRNVMCNGQDSIYLEGSDFDNLTVENNLFCNGTLFWVSRDGKGGTTPTSWKFQRNIFPSIVFDTKTVTNVKSDCNVVLESWVDPNADMFRVTSVDGSTPESYNTLALWQAAKPTLDQGSIELAYGNWTNGQMFKQFVNNSQPFDFHPADLSAASHTMPACSYAGPYGYGR